MASIPLAKITAASAAEICARFTLNKQALGLLREGMAPGEFVEALMANKQYVPGIDFMAHALPPREAVWWGCLCLQHAAGENLSATDKAACRAAVQWVIKPTEENRAATLGPAQAAGAGCPAGQLAIAVNQTGGSIAPPSAPPTPPPPFAPAQAVARAIKMASTKVDPVKVVDTQRLFVGLAIGVAGRLFP